MSCWCGTGIGRRQRQAVHYIAIGGSPHSVKRVAGTPFRQYDPVHGGLDFENELLEGAHCHGLDFSDGRCRVKAHVRSVANVCGQPYSLQIRSHVSKLGERWPTSMSRYSRMLTPRRRAACPTDQPARRRSSSSIPASAATKRRLSRCHATCSLPRLGLAEGVLASAQKGVPPRPERQTNQSKGSSSSCSPDERDARHAGTRNSSARKATLNANSAWTQGSPNPRKHDRE